MPDATDPAAATEEARDTRAAVVLAFAACTAALLTGLAVLNLETAGDHWQEAARSQVQYDAFHIAVAVSAYDQLTLRDDALGAGYEASELNGVSDRASVDFRIEAGAQARYAATLIGELRAVGGARAIADPVGVQRAIEPRRGEEPLVLDARSAGDRAGRRAARVAAAALVASIGFFLATAGRLLPRTRAPLLVAAVVATAAAIVFAAVA